MALSFLANRFRICDMMVVIALSLPAPRLPSTFSRRRERRLSGVCAACSEGVFAWNYPPPYSCSRLWRCGGWGASLAVASHTYPAVPARGAVPRVLRQM